MRHQKGFSRDKGDIIETRLVMNLVSRRSYSISGRLLWVIQLLEPVYEVWTNASEPHEKMGHMYCDFSFMCTLYILLLTYLFTYFITSMLFHASIHRTWIAISHRIVMSGDRLTVLPHSGETRGSVAQREV